MVRIAITGGIACGKSLVASFMTERGVPVCEADEVGHAVLKPGEAVHAAVADWFGPAVLGADGTIDRARLGRLVFADEVRLGELNRLTHPEILRRLRGWVAVQPATAAAVAVVIPLLYEIGDEGNWDCVVCVASPAADQRRRLMERGLTESEARLRIRRQWPQERKMERADYVICNNGSRELLQQQTNDVVRHICGV
jgi:dephospho-CoA kinase